MRIKIRKLILNHTMNTFRHIGRKLKQNKILVSNFSYLAVFNAFSLVFPLITYPYLIKTIGLELNGVIVFGQSLSVYLALFINFGFNISGARSVAINREDRHEVEKTISSIYTSKILIWCLLFVIWLIIINTFQFFKAHYLVYFWSFFITINEVLFPIWFFQGLEKMKYITIVNLSTRLLFIGLIFFLVKDSSQYYRVSFLYAMGAVLAGILSCWIVFYRMRYKFLPPKFKWIKNSIKEGFPLFLSIISIQIYTNISKILVGAFLGMSQVSIYDFCSRMIAVVRMPTTVVQQTIFPKISREKNLKFIKKILLIVLSFNISISVVLLIAFKYLMLFFLHKTYNEAYSVIGIMTIALCLAGINSNLGGGRLIAWGKSAEYSKIAAKTSIFYLTMVAIFWIVGYINLYTITGFTVITEIYACVYFYSKCKKFNLT